MEQVQALIIETSDDKRTVTLVRREGELLRIDGGSAVVLVDGDEIQVPVHLVKDQKKPNILESAITQMTAEVAVNRACLFAAVGEVIEHAEPINTGEYVVPGEEHDQMVDAWARIAVA